MSVLSRITNDEASGGGFENDIPGVDILEERLRASRLVRIRLSCELLRKPSECQVLAPWVFNPQGIQESGRRWTSSPCLANSVMMPVDRNIELLLVTGMSALST